jgi:hypothetical protein
MLFLNMVCLTVALASDVYQEPCNLVWNSFILLQDQTRKDINL